MRLSYVSAMFLLSLSHVLLVSASQSVACLPNHVGCPATFGTSDSGCCALGDPEAVCCQTVLVGPTGPILPGNKGLKRSYCCPKGSECTERGCTRPIPGRALCGPTQGSNCNVSYLCTSGPAAWSGPRPAVVVIGDSVSDGWTPVLERVMNSTHIVVHSPGRLADGGARSTSNFVNCADYLLSTLDLKPLPLKSGDTLLINFGLHDYNLGLAGVAEYRAEYTEGLKKALALAEKVGAKVFILGTTPAHNTADSVADDKTVVALNTVAELLAKAHSLPFVDLHRPLINQCGPTPWADNGTHACTLCAPRCKALSVHYSAAGYEVIAKLIWDAVQEDGPGLPQL